MFRRAKNLRLPTAPSRQYATSGSTFVNSQGPLPRRSARATESDDDDIPENPLDTSVHSRKSLITRPPITARRRWLDKSPSRSEYAPAVARRASPVRSIVSLTNRRSRSPGSSKGPNSVVSGGMEGGKLWMALKEVGFSRQAKNSWGLDYTGLLNYYPIYCALPYYLAYVRSMISCISYTSHGLYWKCGLLWVAIILPSHPVRDNKVWGSGYEEQEKVFVEIVFC